MISQWNWLRPPVASALMNTARYRYDVDDPLVYNNAMGRYKTKRQLLFIRRFMSRENMAVLDIGGGRTFGHTAGRPGTQDYCDRRFRRSIGPAKGTNGRSRRSHSKRCPVV